MTKLNFIPKDTFYVRDGEAICRECAIERVEDKLDGEAISALIGVHDLATVLDAKAQCPVNFPLNTILDCDVCGAECVNNRLEPHDLPYLHKTFQPDLYHTALSNLPKEMQKAILEGEIEHENSRYTVYQWGSFLRGEMTLSGMRFSYEISLGHWDEECFTKEDDDGEERQLDDSECEEECGWMAKELLACTDDPGSFEVYLTYEGHEGE